MCGGGGGAGDGGTTKRAQKHNTQRPADPKIIPTPSEPGRFRMAVPGNGKPTHPSEMVCGPGFLQTPPFLTACSTRVCVWTLSQLLPTTIPAPLLPHTSRWAHKQALYRCGTTRLNPRLGFVEGQLALSELNPSMHHGQLRFWTFALPQDERYHAQASRSFGKDTRTHMSQDELPLPS